MHTIAGAAVLVMALAGCNDEEAAKPGGDAPEQQSSASANPDKPATGKPGDSAEAPGSGSAEDSASAGKPLPTEGEKVPPPQIKASTGLPKGHPEEAYAEGSKLTIQAQESGCEKASAELGAQTASSVTVTLVRTQPKEKMMCTMDIRFPPLTVELDEPIGKRTLVLEHEMRKG